jgi:lipopolysaccharide transport system ATP-binding protein
MSSNHGTAIEFEHVWKRYRLGEFVRRRRRRRRTLKSEITLALERSGLKRVKGEDLSSGYIWALADVSFRVEEGEAVGIIGPNGSGKSTSLKLASRITVPWSGRVRARGRIGSLIEIKSGIHPELTGRENIYLYGTILGLRRKEIKKKFEQIVDFAELHRYIDTPVKRYSSGMEVRLGFSVAAHLDPEILLVDEVLAVGDESFQHRCIERMDELRARGQTLVFVSHVLADVKRLCPRVMYMDRGMIRADGRAEEVINLYLNDVAERDATLRERRPASGLGDGSAEPNGPAGDWPRHPLAQTPYSREPHI